MPVETWGEFDPGNGFLLGRSSAGELSISGYALTRYVNQMPGEQTFTDHLGNERTVDGRNDIWPHRVMIFLKGWVGNPKLVYAVTFWTVLDTDQNAIFGNLGYQFSRKFSVYAGLNGNPGTRSLQGSHPFWLGQDRVMADEFFRPFFGSGVWAQGEAVPGLWYNVMLSNTNSILGVTSSELDRTFSTGASMWWMPTTKEFGPRGAYGDWEMHEKVATRFGFSTTRSPEQRFTNSSGATDNTTLRLADSVNVFDTGALATGVTVDTVNYRILSFDAGLKYKGIFLQTEIYNRWLDNFKADGPLPVTSIHDTGFYVQGAFFPVPKKLEAVRRHLADLRRQGRGLQQQFRVRGGGELLSVRLAQLSPEHPGDEREPLTGQQRVRLLRRRTEGPRRLPSASRCSFKEQRAVRATYLAGCVLTASLAVGTIHQWERRALGAGAGRCESVQRFSLPPDELHPGGHQRARVPEDHGEPGQSLDAVRHSVAAAVVVRKLGGLRADLLPAQ